MQFKICYKQWNLEHISNNSGLFEKVVPRTEFLQIYRGMVKNGATGKIFTMYIAIWLAKIQKKFEKIGKNPENIL